jgi:hypothetical protein
MHKIYIYDNHRTSYLLYINPQNYNTLCNVPSLKTQTYNKHKSIFKSITILQQAQSELDTKDSMNLFSKHLASLISDITASFYSFLCLGALSLSALLHSLD